MFIVHCIVCCPWLLYLLTLHCHRVYLSSCHTFVWSLFHVKCCTVILGKSISLLKLHLKSESNNTIPYVSVPGSVSAHLKAALWVFIFCDVII